MDITYYFDEKRKNGQKSVDLLIPILNDTYKNAQFERVDNGGDADRKFSIDIKVDFPDRTETWASKIREPYSRNFDDITVEIMNGDKTKGDFYRFKGGIISKYIYGWRENKTFYDLYICNAEKLVSIPISFWKGNIKKDFPGIGTVDCYQNGKYGKSWFTAMNIVDLQKIFPNVIEDILNKNWAPSPSDFNFNQKTLFGE